MSDKKTMTQADIDAVQTDENGVRHFGDRCKFGDGCKFLKNCTFGLRPLFGERCCFCAPIDYMEYVERTKRQTHVDSHNAKSENERDKE